MLILISPVMFMELRDSVQTQSLDIRPTLQGKAREPPSAPGHAPPKTLLPETLASRSASKSTAKVLQKLQLCSFPGIACKQPLTLLLGERLGQPIHALERMVDWLPM